MHPKVARPTEGVCNICGVIQTVPNVANAAVPVALTMVVDAVAEVTMVDWDREPSVIEVCPDREPERLDCREEAVHVIVGADGRKIIRPCVIIEVGPV